MKKLIIATAAILCAVAINAKTLVAYYSYTNNVERIVNALSSQIECDVVKIEPAEKGLDYSANNYALGSQLLNAIRNNPHDESSYPAIDAVNINMDDYDMVVIACPLWWNQMAAPFQTFLFQYGGRMTGKNIAVIVSSASSGISGVVADARRLVPEGNFIEPYLWVRSSQTSDATSMVTTWLEDIDYDGLTAGVQNIAANGDFEIKSTNGVIEIHGKFDTLSLYDFSGNKMIETAENPIAIRGLAPGIYIAQAHTGNHSVYRKINVR